MFKFRKANRAAAEADSSPSRFRRFFATRRENIADVVMNFVIWMTVLVGLVIMSLTAHVFDEHCNIKVGLEFLHFVDVKLWLAQILGGSMAIGVVGIARSFFTRKEGAPIQMRALDEFSAVFRNFGSIFLISAILIIATEKTSPVGWANLGLGLFNLMCCALRRDRGGSLGEEHA